MFQLFGKKKARKQLEKLLEGSEPPMLRVGALKVLKLLRDPDSTLEEIANEFAYDPGFVVRVLRTVNSAAFGLRQTIDSVQHAAAILGRAKLEQLMLSMAVKEAIPSQSVRGFDASRFWNCAFFRASLARSIAEKIHPIHQSACFTAGLLQDMAIPVMAHARDDYGPILEHWHSSRDGCLRDLEQRALGFSHDEAGGLLAAEWELPEALARSIHLHHDQKVGDDELLPALRLVAAHRETEVEYGIEVIVEDGRSLYGLDPDWLAGSIEQSNAQAQELSQSF